MNFPKIYRRFAAAAIGILIVGLIPASALAVGPETFVVDFSVLSVSTSTSTAGQALDVTITSYQGSSPDPAYAGVVTLTSTTDPIAVLGGPCDFGASETPGQCSLPGGVKFNTAGLMHITVSDGESSSDSGDVTVSHAALFSFASISPADDTIAAHASDVYTVIGQDSHGNTWDATATTNFSMDGDGSCVANSCSSNTAAVYTVTAADQTIPATTISTGLTVNPAAMNKFGIVGPSTATAGTSGLYTVTAEDQYGNTIADYAGSITITSGDSTVSSVVHTSLLNGVESFDVTLNTAGLQTVGATDGTHTASSPVSVTVGSSSLNKLVITGPTTATAGNSGLYTVTAQDQYGNPITGYAGSITITSGDSTVSSVVHTALSNGVEKFDVTLDTAGLQTVGATDGALVASPPVNVTVAHAGMNKLVIDGPVTATAGTSGLYTVTAEDQFGNPITNYAGAITITSGDSTMSAVVHTALLNGVESFDVTLDTAALETVGAHDNLAHTASPSVSVLVGHAAVLTLTISPTNDTILAGASDVYTVTGHDAFGNTWNATSTSNFSIDAGASCTLNSCTSTTAGPYTVTAADQTTPAILITTSLTVTHAAMNKLVLGGPASANRTVLASFTVTAEDQYGNVVGNYAGSPTITIGDPQALPLTSTPAMVTGVGHFDVTFGTQGDQTISATDGTFSATDLTVHVLPSGSATHLVITGPATAVTTHFQNYTVTAENGSNVQVADYTGDVTVSATGGTSSPTHANLVGGAGVFAVTFTTVGSQTITAGDGTITGTLPVTVKTFGPATKFIVAGGASAAAPSTQNFTVTAEDQYNQTVLDYPGIVKITSSDGGAVLPANSTLTNGVKVFSVTLLTAGTQTVTATDTVDSSITGTSTSVITITRIVSTYHPITPTRLLDTRNGNGLSGGKARLIAGAPTLFHIGGRGGVTTNAVAVTVNVTVVYPGSSSTLYLGPAPIAHPSTYTIAFNKGDVTAYGSTVALSGLGDIYGTYMASSGTTDLVLDVTGYFTPDLSGDTYHPLTPARLLDTRSANGLSGKFKALVPRQFTVRGRGGVPAGAKAVTGNLTTVNSNNSWAVYLGPTSQKAPQTSTINFAKGQVRANSLTVILSPTGTLWATFLSSAKKTTDLVFDVTGYYTADLSGTKYVPIAPVPLVDTRSSIGIVGRIPANSPKTTTITNRGGVPTNATGITGILGVLGQSSSWAAFVGPVPTAKPSTSALNFLKGDNCSNGFTVALSTSPAGQISVTYMGSAGNTTDMIVFVTGYFVP